MKPHEAVCSSQEGLPIAPNRQESPFDDVPLHARKERPVQDDDKPTVPRLPHYPTSSGREPDEMPTWPAIERQSTRAAPGSVPATTLATGLAVSLVANGALLVALVSVLLFAHAGFLSPRNPSPQSTP